MLSSLPKVSVLIPIYNGIEFIHESVTSILNQTEVSWELIIGINGHAEKSIVFQMAKAYELLSPQKIRVLDLHTIRGKSAALNEMVKYANADYVAILDVDDIWLPIKLEKQMPYISAQYDVIGTKSVFFGQMSGIVPRIPTGDISLFDFFSVNPVINSSALIKKELARWDEEYGSKGVEDYNLWLTLRKQNKRFFNCDEVLIKHRIHQTSAFNAKGNHNYVPELLAKHREL